MIQYSTEGKLKRWGCGRLQNLLLTMLILFSFIMMRAQRRKANISLCFSNKLRHTLLYRLKVKNSLMLMILCSTVSVRNMERQWEDFLIFHFFLHMVPMCSVLNFVQSSFFVQFSMTREHKQFYYWSSFYLLSLSWQCQPWRYQGTTPESTGTWDQHWTGPIHKKRGSVCAQPLVRTPDGWRQYPALSSLPLSL